VFTSHQVSPTYAYAQGAGSFMKSVQGMKVVIRLPRSFPARGSPLPVRSSASSKNWSGVYIFPLERHFATFY